MQERLMPWSRLRRESRGIVTRIYRKWRALLEDRSANEATYRQFLAEHAGFFLQTNDSFVSISELRLGAEYRVDLVRTADRASYGFEYELIELETPHTNAFNKKGIPSKALNNALQQVRDWRRWISEHRSEAKRLFPSKTFSLFDREFFSYTVIIGRRSDNKLELDRRNQLSAEQQIQIRSYDYLSDIFQRGLFTEDVILCSCEADRLPPSQRNELANPFAEAMTDGEWREFLRNSPDICHMTANNAQLILDLRRYNSLFAKFDRATKDVSNDEVREHFFDVLLFQKRSPTRPLSNRGAQ